MAATVRTSSLVRPSRDDDGEVHDIYRVTVGYSRVTVGYSRLATSDQVALACSCVDLNPTMVCPVLRKAIREGWDTPLNEEELEHGINLQTMRNDDRVAAILNPGGIKKDDGGFMKMGTTILVPVSFHKKDYGLKEASVNGLDSSFPIGIIDPRSDGRRSIIHMFLEFLYSYYREAVCKDEMHYDTEYSDTSEFLKDPTKSDVLHNVFCIFRSGRCRECLVGDLVPNA